MDDIIILSGSKKELHKIRAEINRHLNEELFISLKENWQVFPVDVRGIDFVGYRFFHNYILLRKGICIRMKNSLRQLMEKFNEIGTISFKDWCSANSYVGWLTWCNSWRFYEKYFKPVIRLLLLYYAKKILGRKLSIRRWVTRFKKYAERLLMKKGLKHGTLNFQRFYFYS